MRRTFGNERAQERSRALVAVDPMGQIERALQSPLETIQVVGRRKVRQVISVDQERELDRPRADQETGKDERDRPFAR